MSDNTGCGACGADGTIYLSKNEIRILKDLQERAFLPIGSLPGVLYPWCMEYGEESTEEIGQAIMTLSHLRLVQVDYDLPLSGFDYRKYEDCRKKGSIALTQRGQQMLEMIDIQGIEE